MTIVFQSSSESQSQSAERPLVSPTQTRSPSPSPSSSPNLPAPTDFGPFGGEECKECRIGSVVIDLQSNSSELLPIIVRSPDGEVIGSLFLPQSYANSGFVLEVVFASGLPYFPGDPRTPFDLGNVVFDINLFDSLGRPVTSLPEPITICFTESQSSNNRTQKKDNACLGYFDEAKGKWICEDKCLKGKAGAKCGVTGKAIIPL